MSIGGWITFTFVTVVLFGGIAYSIAVALKKK